MLLERILPQLEVLKGEDPRSEAAWHIAKDSGRQTLRVELWMSTDKCRDMLCEIVGNTHLKFGLEFGHPTVGIPVVMNCAGYIVNLHSFTLEIVLLDATFKSMAAESSKILIYPPMCWKIDSLFLTIPA